MNIKRPLVSADVIELILKRLPVKSLLRFKSVSKEWNYTICDRGFAVGHLCQSKKSSSYENMFLADSIRGYDFFLSRLENNELKPLLDLNCSEKDILWRVKRNHCCDGLITLGSFKDFPYSVSVWNPSARTYSNLEFPFSKDLSYSTYNFNFTYGIGFDPLSRGYKVVVVDFDLKQFTTFDNINQRWKELKKMEIIEYDLKNFPLDGHIHLWQKIETKEDSFDIQMIFFNPRDDKFYKFFYHVRTRTPNYFTHCYVDCPPGLFCVLLGDIDSDKCRVVLKKTGGEWMEFDDAPVPWKPTNVTRLDQVAVKMFLSDDGRELILAFGFYQTNLIVYNLIERKVRKISQPVNFCSVNALFRVLFVVSVELLQ
ncbi:F-box/kelch-repeat protein At2g43270-like [Andrographis paniculata]|uniref:F-box/kelch-repeat protein At2g43270-like n=1 Tax=Andrographis paniculata TaxID=175694 RepID=UPI0021E89268|nr:F-box/kelch-repeat protein At2g43270-like [Andrographis paniculata]